MLLRWGAVGHTRLIIPAQKLIDETGSPPAVVTESV
jgi:hypothetical protein